MDAVVQRKSVLRAYLNNRLTVQRMKPDRDVRAQRRCAQTDLLLRQSIPDRHLVPSESVISLRCADGRYQQRRDHRHEPFSGLIEEGRCLTPPRVSDYIHRRGSSAVI